MNFIEGCLDDVTSGFCPLLTIILLKVKTICVLSLAAIFVQTFSKCLHVSLAKLHDRHITKFCRLTTVNLSALRLCVTLSINCVQRLVNIYRSIVYCASCPEYAPHKLW